MHEGVKLLGPSLIKRCSLVSLGECVSAVWFSVMELTSRHRHVLLRGGLLTTSMEKHNGFNSAKF